MFHERQLPKVFACAGVAVSLLSVALAANAKDVNACDRIAYDAPAATTIGQSVFSCPLSESGTRATLITKWSLVDGAPKEIGSLSEISIDGTARRAPIGKLFLVDDVNLAPRTQMIACNGYFDLLVPHDGPGGRNSSFAVWRFDPKRNRYIEDKQLSRLVNPTPSPGCSCYESYTHGGGDNFTHQRWCKRRDRWVKTRELVQRSLGTPKISDPRDYPESVCDVRDMRFDANGKAAMQRSKRCVDPQDIAMKK
jgi:hypothetical protein